MQLINQPQSGILCIHQYLGIGRMLVFTVDSHDKSLSINSIRMKVPT